MALIVKKSQLPNSGKGLFTTTAIKKGTRIIEYLGEIIDWKELHLMRSKCLMAPFYPCVEIRVKPLDEHHIESSLIIDIKLGPFALVPKKLIQSQIDVLVLPMVNKFIELLEG